MLSGLAEAGITPEQVTIVVLTHRDMDHVGGNVRDGAPVYPNARYVMGRTEYVDFQADKDRAEAFAKYISAVPNLHVIEDNGEIVPGVRFLLTPGHRSGATSLLVDSDAIVLADVWHASFQVTHPNQSINFDSDPALAAETRAKVVELAKSKGFIVAVPHTPYFGLGWIREQDGLNVWIPIAD